MRLSMLRESITTAAIAISPNSFAGQSEKPVSEYMGISKNKQPKLKKTLVWQPQEKTTHKKSKADFAMKFAGPLEPKSRILPSARKYGYD